MGLAHWDKVWSRRQPDEVSWFQDRAEISHELIARVAAPWDGLLDVGGGASVLIDQLLDDGYDDLTVIDISPAPIAAAQQRLGDRAAGVEWLVGDITSHAFGRTFHVWHDRALLHFLLDDESIAGYRNALYEALQIGGHAIIAAFGPDGPETCSGLPVRRYDALAMGEVLGDGLCRIDAAEEAHRTPAGVEQHFVYGLYERVAAA